MIIKDHYVNIFTDLPIMYPVPSIRCKVVHRHVAMTQRNPWNYRILIYGRKFKIFTKRSERGIWENQFISIRSIIQSSTIILQRPRPLTLCTYTGTVHITFFRPQRHSYKTKSQFSVLTTSSPSSTSLIDGVAGVLIFELSSTSES